MSDEKSEKRLEWQFGCAGCRFVKDSKTEEEVPLSVYHGETYLKPSAAYLLIDHINELHERIDRLDDKVQCLEIGHADNYATLCERVGRILRRQRNIFDTLESQGWELTFDKPNKEEENG